MAAPQAGPPSTCEDILIKSALRLIVRDASASRLRGHTGAQIIETEELAPPFRPGRILGSNMVYILVSVDAVRLTFKIHFNVGSAKKLAYSIFGGTAISEKQAIDYIKEYANLVAGNVVSLLAEYDVDLGISLPLCTRGFYEVFSDYTEKAAPIIAYNDFWNLKVNGLDLFCSSQFEVMNMALLEKVGAYRSQESTEESDLEIEFL